MNWGIDFNVIIQLASFVFIAGMGWMKIDALEKDITRLEKEVVDGRTVSAKLLVLETKLESMDEKLDRVIGVK